MTPTQLAIVRAASRREDAHRQANKQDGATFHDCDCKQCVADRGTIARCAPGLLEDYDEALKTLAEALDKLGGAP